MQPISLILMLIVGYITLITMTCALSEQKHQMDEMHAKQALRNKRFYDFGSRSVHANEEDLQNVNDEFDRSRRFYDFGTRKRFYDFGSKKRSDE
ncbi:hypothetical protein I4U23_025790 [Adineta vaga]|nr:hypothetical protein I4U23_025790 [Adineta vaga]